MTTLLVDTTNNDLVLDAYGNMAVATSPYSDAQDAASAIKTFLGEVWFDTTIGVPYLTQIFGVRSPLAILKQRLIEAALTVPNVVSAQVFISGISERLVAGQVQIVNSSGQIATASFVALSPGGSA